MTEMRLRDVPEQTVLTTWYRNVTQDQVADLNREGMARLADEAGAYGGVAGPFFTIFHDREYDPTDITFEVCTPVSAAEAPPEARVEPAHREAYARVRKEQVPAELGGVYGEVTKWITDHGHEIAGPPREVYFTNFATAAPGDEVFDVAFPIA